MTDQQNPPDVSIIVAAWNAEKTIAQALTSGVEQAGVTTEVIVVDDASTDKTAEIVGQMSRQEPRIIAHSQERNRGPAAARNYGLKVARAPFVAILDADDIMAPSRMSELLRIAREGDWDIVADDLYKVAGFGPEFPRERLWSTNDFGRVTVNFEEFVKGNLTSLHGGRGELGFLKPLIRRTFLARESLRYEEDMRLGEDYALYATALARGARFCLTDPLGYFALVRPDSLSGRHDAAALGALVRADSRLEREPSLGPAERRILRSHKTETQKRWRWLRLIEAVKARDLRGAVGCFLAPPSVVLSLLSNLGEQVWLRSLAKGSRVFGRSPASRRRDETT